MTFSPPQLLQQQLQHQQQQQRHNKPSSLASASLWLTERHVLHLIGGYGESDLLNYHHVHTLKLPT